VIHVRIFHGSFAKPFQGDHYRELGGLFGGHVAVQIYDRVYGFYYADRNNIHILPNKENKRKPSFRSLQRKKKSSKCWPFTNATWKLPNGIIPFGENDAHQTVIDY
jgi:hypothetical protein